jgi:cation/acetate symporter
VGTIIINLAYLIPQMAGSGVLIKLLFGFRYDVSVPAGWLRHDHLRLSRRHAGNELGADHQGCASARRRLHRFSVIAQGRRGFDPLVLFASAAAKAGPNFLLLGNLLKNPFDEVSLGLGYMLGPAGLPHVMTRFYTVPYARTARRSVIWVMFLAGAFFACTTIFGLAAVHYLGPHALRISNPGGNLTLPLLAQYFGGAKGTADGVLMLGFVAAVAVATILAVVAALTLATSGAVANDLYVNLFKKGKVEEHRQVLVARISAVVIGIIATLLGILAEGVNVAVLVILAICIAAGANFPVLAPSLFWWRFNTAGVIGGVGLGLISSVGLALIRPAYLGPNELWPLVNPTVVALPIGILGAVLGSLIAGRDHKNEKRFSEVTFRVQTGL